MNPFKLSNYPLTPITQETKIEISNIEISNNPRLNKLQKINIREGLGSAGAVACQHPLHQLYEALKKELDLGSSSQEASLNDFTKRFCDKESDNVAGRTFLETIQNKSQDLYLKGLAQSADEDSEKSGQRQFEIFVYVTDTYPIPS